MCEFARRSRRLLFCATLTAVAFAPRAGSAQSVDRLRERLLASSRRAEWLKDSLAELHQMRSHEMPADSIMVGDLKFRFLRSNVGDDVTAELRVAGKRALAVADSVLGDELPRVARETPILVTRSNSRYGEILRVNMVNLEIANGGGRSTLVRAPITQGKLEEAILDLLGTMATSRVPSSVVGWGGEWVPARPTNPEQWEDAAIDMASSKASIARTCYVGSVPACESALALVVVHDPLNEWYTPDGWRILVATWMPPKDADSVLAERMKCLDQKVNASCERLARSRSIPIPLTFGTRSTLMSLAFQRGGRDAYSRMLRAQGTTLQVLAATAGITPDSLIREWHARVIASSPKSASPSPLEATVFIAWALLFGSLAARRRP